MADIFISYSRRDSDFVDNLIQLLKESGFDPWVDREGISGGSAWQTVISNAIRECQTLIIVLSPNSAASEYVTKEITLADKHNKKIIPLMCRPCEIPPAMELQLAGLQNVDFVQMPHDKAFAQLFRALGSEKSAPAAAQPAPPAQVQPTPAIPAAQFQPLQPAAGLTDLAQVLSNSQWQVQIVIPALGNQVAATAVIEFYSNGTFQEQIQKAPPTYVSGQWQIIAPNTISLMGQETNGFQVGPYQTVIQFSQVTPTQLAGVTQMNEQVFFQRSA